MAKIFPVVGYITFVLLGQMIPSTEATKSPDYLYYIFQTGVAGVLFVVWRITQKSSTDAQQKFVEQSSAQYVEIFNQLKTVHKDAMDQNNRILDKMFSILQEDVKYKALIAQTIASFESKLSNHLKSRD